VAIVRVSRKVVVRFWEQSTCQSIARGEFNKINGLTQSYLVKCTLSVQLRRRNPRYGADRFSRKDAGAGHRPARFLAYASRAFRFEKQGDDAWLSFST
jgi:hypothetical protein